MSKDSTFLSVEYVIEINCRRVAETGGSHHVRDQELLESAVAEPQQTFDGEYLHKDLFDMAAYAFSLAKNHTFEQGNKRAALETAITFLIMNGYKTVEAYERELVDWIFAIVEDKADQETFADHLADCSVPLARDGNEKL